jgi:hypothetical protein
MDAPVDAEAVSRQDFTMTKLRCSALMVALLALTSCAGTETAPKSEPSFYRDLAKPGAELDGAAAASMISGYRANNNLPAVTLDGWRDSPPHRANMLLKGATRIGIAAVYTPSSKYKLYWSLILAEPDDRKG